MLTPVVRRGTYTYPKDNKQKPNKNKQNYVNTVSLWYVDPESLFGMIARFLQETKSVRTRTRYNEAFMKADGKEARQDKKEATKKEKQNNPIRQLLPTNATTL